MAKRTAAGAKAKGARTPRRRSAQRARSSRPAANARTTQRRPRSVAAPAIPARLAHPEFELKDDVIERALRTGEDRGLLEDYFGADQYAELRELSREVAARGVRGGPKVLILPGIMGSKIGVRGTTTGAVDDVVWVDPLDIAAGNLLQLALKGPRNPFTAVGVILLAYLRLKLRLRASGYDADFYPFDWRLSIDTLGKQLTDHIKSMTGPVNVVAHSMGGLVARAAIAQGAPVRRLIMLGTPNFGSFAPVMAFRATYPLVRKVAALDLRNSPEDLAQKVFATFPGLTQMLPNPAVWNALDLYDLNSWPDDGLRPQADILAAAPGVQQSLPEGQKTFFLIAGVDQKTVVAVKRDAAGGFVYDFSQAGDGTVPLDFARLPNIAATYYVAEAHGSLPNNAVVAQAVSEILAKDETSRLKDTYAGPTRAAAVDSVPERALRTDPYQGRSRGMLSQNELRTLIDEVAAPSARSEPSAAPASLTVPSSAMLPTEPGYAHVFDRIVVSRRRQHRIDLRFALGSITEVDARAIALGVFRGVTPTGAASAVDRRMQGAITEVARRRMFAGGVGEIFMLPTGRHPIATDLVTFVGLGDFDRVNDETLQAAAENLLRTFVHARVEEFATVLFGAGSGERPESALRNLLLGFTRGLVDADKDHHFRRIIICENDPARYLALKQEMYRLSSTPICADVELTFDEVALPAETISMEQPRGARPGETPVYLMVRQERAPTAKLPAQVRSSVLTAGAKATVVTGTAEYTAEEFEALRRRIVEARGNNLAALGGALTEMVLSDEVRTVLARFADRPLVVVHDGALSRAPWEVMALPSPQKPGTTWFPAVTKGLTHRYAADKLSVAKWLEQRRHDSVLSVLLVVDPTQDLEGAVAEGKRVRSVLGQVPGVRITELWQQAATRPALLQALRSGDFDAVHYAGHAFFDEGNPGRSGLVCSGQDVLSGADVAGLSGLPAVVFFNACEAGRVRGGARGGAGRAAGTERKIEQLTRSMGVAEAFLRGGIANFLGTYWPVGDAAASTFADKFYTRLLAGDSVGKAVQAGRMALYPDDKDWANYLFYGDPDFGLKDAP